MVASASPPTSRVCWPGGKAATKKRVSYRRGSASGVIQCAHGRSRSARRPRPRRSSRQDRLASWSIRASRSASQSGPADVDDLVRSGAGEQHAGFLERLAYGRADQPVASAVVRAQHACPHLRAGAEPPRRERPCRPDRPGHRERRASQRRSHRRDPAEQVGLQPGAPYPASARWSPRRGSEAAGVDALAQAGENPP